MSSSRPGTLILLSVLCTALAYTAIGLPLAVLPGWVVHDLGYGTALAGAAVSVQYAATIVSRGVVGHVADTAGPRRSILLGLGCCAASGLTFLLAARAAPPAAALGTMLASRLALGFGESLVGTGAIAWAIGRTDAAQTARIISWNGIATYGGIALGAPLGVWLHDRGGMAAVGAASLAIGLAGLGFVLPQPATRPIPAERMRFRHVFARTAPYGLVLALGAAGFGTVSAFVALLYAARGWGEAWIALSAFGVAFIVSRLIFVGSIARHGGLRVSTLFLGIEAAGLATIWAAPDAALAVVGAALAGGGFALLFPALGLIVVDLVPPQNRAAAIGAYSMFTDLALCVTGPVAGAVAARAGSAAPFLVGAAAALTGLCLAATLMRRRG